MKAARWLAASIAAAAIVAWRPAAAVPALQLDILGGTYDTASETIFAPASNTFSVYAYGRATLSGVLSDDFFLSIALVPASSAPASLGSFSYTVNSVTTTVSVTGGMTYGTPPLETILGGAGFDPGDLPSHGMYPTWFAEAKFKFSPGDQSGVYDTQANPGWGPQPGTGMYYKRFDFNIAGLPVGYGLHFDLYSEKVCINGRGQCNGRGDIDVDKFAPFSHDAQAMVIPEPSAYAMLLAGLGVLGFFARRRKESSKDASSHR